MVGAALTTVGIFTAPARARLHRATGLWLWFTVLFANFAEAVAEGRGKAQADSLRKARKDTMARRLRNGREEKVPAPDLQKGDLVVCEAGDIIPADGDVVEGIASVDESAITGESAPVIRESGGDRSAVTGGTRVLSDRIVIRVTMEKGARLPGPHDRAGRRRATPEDAERNRAHDSAGGADAHLPAGLRDAEAVRHLFGRRVLRARADRAAGLPDSDDHRRLAERHRHRRHGPRAPAQRAGDERARGRSRRRRGRAAARQDRHDHARQPHGHGVSSPRRACQPNDSPTPRNSPRSPTKRPKAASIVVLAKEKFDLRGREVAEPHATFVPFTAQTRMSGVDLHAQRRGQPTMRIRKGAADAIRGLCRIGRADMFPAAVSKDGGRDLPHRGGTPLVVARKAAKCSASIHLKDVVKGGIKERFAQLRKMGIRTVMITGDNPLTAAAIAAEAGVDDFIAQATPEEKLKRIREEQAAGPSRRHDRRRHQRRAGARAGRRRRRHEHRHAGRARSRQHGGSRQQSDQADRDRRNRQTAADDARRADHVQHRQRRGEVLRHHSGDADGDVSRRSRRSTSCTCSSPTSAILSAVIFNALIIIALIPLALRGVAYKPIGALAILQRNLLIYGFGGLIVPFIGIKLIDLIITALHLV